MNTTQNPLVAESMATSLFLSGYLSREGEFYGCGFQQHHQLAQRIVEQRYPTAAVGGYTIRDSYRFNAHYYLEKIGWFKLDRTNFYYNTIRHEKDPFYYPSPAQVAAVVEWFEARELSYLYYNNLPGSSLVEFLAHVQPQ